MTPTGRLLALVALTLAPFAPLHARPTSWTMLVFSAKPQGTASGPCAVSGARATTTWRLRREITKVPGLPPVMTQCSVPAGTRAPSAPAGVVIGLYRPIGADQHAVREPRGSADGERFSLVILAEAVPGRDAEFNRWYDRIHIPAVLRNPGFESAQRYRLVSSSKPLPAYGAIYQFASSDLGETIAGVRQRLADGRTPMSTSFDYATAINRYYQYRGE